MTKLATTAFQTNIITQIQDTLGNSADNSYYLFVGEHVARSSNTIPTPMDKVRTTYVDAYRQMLFGKKISNTDIKPMITKNDWTAGTVYDMYDDNNDNLLSDSNFFVVVDETSYHHVYKCLDNNQNTVSTSQPTFSHITGSNAVSYQTSDGYRWKYMYSFSESEDAQFSTASYIPVTANTAVSGNATAGALDVIKLDTTGRNYGNYTTGTFSGTDVRIGGDSLLYKVANTNLSQTNGYYTGCLIYISVGTGVGQYKTISNYYSNSSGSYAVVNNAFTTAPQNGSTYEINPRVVVTGGGEETSVAVGRALINALATNSIYRIEMLSHGAGYSYHTANVIANSVVGVTSVASLRPIYSPRLGHGYDPAIELGAKHMAIGVNLAGTESNTIPALNTFQKVGIIKGPTFANVVFSYYNANGTFAAGETVHKVTPIRVDTAASINTTSAVLSSNTGNYANQFSVGDYVYLESANCLAHMVSAVASITNATHMTLSSNGKFSCGDASVSIANVTANATVNAITNTTHMVFDRVSGVFGTTDTFIGYNSGARAQVNSVFRNDIAKNFDTFVQMYKYTGTMTSGTFSDDELVYQGGDLSTSTANARLHSANISGGTATIYTTEQIGQFVTAESVIGNSSTSSATISAKYSPELVHGTGEILHLENIQTVTRANNTTESFKILFEFTNE